MRASRIVALFLLATSQSAFAATNAIAPPIGDTWVTPANPTSGSGHWARTLEVGPGEIYLQFRLPRAHRIQSAVLHAPGSGHGRFEISRLADDDWIAWQLTWNARPSTESTPIAVQQLPSPSPSTFDVTDAVQAEQLGDGILSLRIAAIESTDSATYPAREATTADGLYLDLVVETPPRVQAGELVMVGIDRGIVAIDPRTHIRRQLGVPDRLDWPSRIAIDPRDGSVVLTDPGNEHGVLFRVGSSNGSLTRIALSDGWLPTSGVAVEHDGSIVLAARRSGVDAILRFDAVGMQQSVLTQGGLLAPAGGIEVQSDGSLLVAGRADLVRVDALTGAQTSLATGFFGWDGQATSGADAYWISGDTDILTRIDRSTSEQTFLGPLAVGPIAQMFELADGRLLVATRGVGFSPSGANGTDDPDAVITIGIFDPVTGSVQPILEKPHTGFGGMARAPDGRFVVCFNDSYSGPYLVRIDPLDGSEAPVAAPLTTAITWVARLAIDSDGSLLHAAGDRVLRLDPATGAQESVISDGVRREFGTWASGGKLFRDLDGRMLAIEWVAPPQTGTRIVALERSGRGRVVVQTPVVLESAIVEDADSFLGVESGATGLPFGAARVWRIDRASGAAEPITFGQGIQSARDLVLTQSGELFVADYTGQALRQVDRATGAITTPVQTFYLFQNHVLRGASGVLWVHGPGGIGSFDPTTGQSEMIAEFNEIDFWNTSIAIAAPRCADGWDNDGDGAIDYPADPSCASAEQDRETARSCGVGAEILLALVAIARASRRRSARGI